MPKAPLLPPLEACREQALKLLDIRPHAEAELRRKLVKSGKHTGADIQAVMADLRRLGLVDDRTFARLFCESLKGQGIGRLKAQFKMRSRGLSAQLVQETLESLWATDDAEETERAMAAAERKWRSLCKSGKPLLNMRQSLARFLVSRGFQSNIVGAVLNRGEFKKEIHQ